MTSIGFRCWPDKIAFVVFDGTRSDPIVVTHEVRRAPRGENRAEILSWLRLEVLEILERFPVQVGFFKGMEPTARNKDIERAEFEGVIQEAALSHRSRIELKKRIKIQIKRDTNFQDRPRYLGRLFENETLSSLNTNNYSDACLAALCGLSVPNAHG